MVLQATSQYVHRTLKNSSMSMSNMIGPVEQMALANHNITGMYFAVVGNPQVYTYIVVNMEYLLFFIFFNGQYML